MGLGKFLRALVSSSPAGSIKAMRPLAPEIVPPCYRENSRSFQLTADGLAAWARSPEFRSVLKLSRSYDAFDSLQSDNSRAFLYHLILVQRPERVLEIGTFRAGTARFLAQALDHTGRGLVYTIDPFGIYNNVPSAIKSWPAHLRARVSFSPTSSAAFFERAITDGQTFDMVLIDGNHEFEYASFDLACSARLLNPGGIIVLDNVDQPGPRYATQRFLAANPGWREVPGAAVLPLADAKLAQLPNLPQKVAYRMAWTDAENIVFNVSGDGPLAGFPAIKLGATEVAGVHRLGSTFSRLAANQKYRLVVWLASADSDFVMVDVRDAQASNSQIFCDLRRRVVLRQTGPITDQARIERDGRWNRLVLDFDCESGAGYVYLAVLSRGEADVMYPGDVSSSIMFGGVEILAPNESGEYERAEPLGSASLLNRDLSKLDDAEPFGVVAPSFPDTKLFALKAPDGLEVSSIPRSFGSMPNEAAGAGYLELNVAQPTSGILHYQIFCRAFSEIEQPEELMCLGSVKIDPTVIGKVKFKLANRLALKATREHAHYRIEILLAFVPSDGGGRLYLREPPTTSQT